MNFTQLELLTAIARLGSFTEAADAVGVTQSAASHAITKLEAELGVTLLERSSQGVHPTRIGEDVLPNARLLLAQVEIIRQKAARAQGMNVGKVRFGCVRQMPPRLLTAILREFQQQYPDIEVVLFEGTSIEIGEWLHNGIIDVGTVPTSDGFDNTILLAEDAIHLILPASHPLASHDTIHVSQVQDEPFIGTRTEIALYKQMLPTEAGVDIRYQVTEMQTILAMVAEGMGVSIAPSYLITPDAAGIVAKPMTPSPVMRAFLASTTESPAGAAFMHVAQTCARDQGLLPD